MNARSCAKREFYRVTDFDLLQNPKRPKRPTWVKSYTRDLDSPDYRNLSLSVRGFYCDFIKLAAILQNRVPDDARFIAHRLGVRPQDVAKAMKRLMSLDYVTRFVEDFETSKINDLMHLTDSKEISAESACISISHSLSESAVRRDLHNTAGIAPQSDQVCPQCDGEGCAWCQSRASFGQMD